MIDVHSIERWNEATLEGHRRAFERVAGQASDDGIDPEAVIDAVQSLELAAPSWALGTGGTRFGRFPAGGEPRTVEEKIDDVAVLHRLTGSVPRISLHVPWDDPRDPNAVRAHAERCGIGFDAMNSNTFQDHPSTTGTGELSFKFGSLAHTDGAVRRLAIDHNVRVIQLGEALGSSAITIWLADGTNHPGQASFRHQFDRVATCLATIHDAMPAGWQMFTEHKPYEPAFYSSVNHDWGASLLLAQAAGERARCLVDLGHHLPNANIPQIVSRLAMTGRLGGFHFNDSMYGDDDLTVGSIDPFGLFLIMVELFDAGDGTLPPLAYMIDASHNIKDPLEDLLQSVEALQVATAQAAVLDRAALFAAQEGNDAALAQQLLQDAFRADVRPFAAEARRRTGASLDPLGAFRELGIRWRLIEQRGASGIATGL
jgi:L-rhamnose isomerase/sugar isomerase